MLQTKYVIVMHNRDEFAFEESPLLDEYPKPEVIEYYLSKSSYRYAKVEKRYSLQFSGGDQPMVDKQWKIIYTDEYGDTAAIFCSSEQELQYRCSELDQEGLLYQVIEL